MTGQRRYNTPAAARAAVTDKLRGQAANSLWQLSDLQRQYAYDQLVERLYRLDKGWVIKGATALLARKVSVRHTIDIDVYLAGAITDVERQVRDAAALDIGDWMRFEVGPSMKVQAAGAQAARVSVKSFVGTKVWAAFQVDIVADGIEMTGEPDTVLPLTSIEILGQERAPWRAYPLVDHVADKVCAIVERYDGRPSTRFKDLIDLVAITLVVVFRRRCRRRRWSRRLVGVAWFCLRSSRSLTESCGSAATGPRLDAPPAFSRSNSTTHWRWYGRSWTHCCPVPQRGGGTRLSGLGRCEPLPLQGLVT